jgi:hypothetical protein
MEHRTARAGVLARALPAAFESSCLIRCADVTRLPGRRPPEREGVLAPAAPFGDAVAEFDEIEAADRLTSLLTALGCVASSEVHTGGVSRRYDVQRVLVAGEQRLATGRMIAAAWRQGRLALVGTETLGASSPRHAQRVTLARCAWRAALLAGGRRRRGEFLWVRLGDHEMVAVLVRAARLLGTTAEVIRRPGCLVVSLPAGTASDLLTTAASAAA